MVTPLPVIKAYIGNQSNDQLIIATLNIKLQVNV